MNRLTVIPPPSLKEREAISEINDLYARAEEKCGYCVETMRNAVLLAWQAGRLLNEQKVLVRRRYGHGQWELWVRANLRVSMRTAQRYMAFAKKVTDVEVLANLSIRQAARKLGMVGEQGGASADARAIPVPEHIRVVNRFLKCFRKLGRPSALPKEKQVTFRRDLKPMYEWLGELFK